MVLRKISAALCALMLAACASGSNDVLLERAETDVQRGLEMLSAARKHYIPNESSMRMYRWYNPVENSNPRETGSVWMYTSAIEATVALMEACVELKDSGRPALYDSHFAGLSDFLSKLVDGLEWYRGTYTLTSYTRTASWSVFAVDRARRRGHADVTGKLNVYDDQQWLVRELLSAYRLTGRRDYLSLAEYLTEYIIDGWDCTLAPDGTEHGGITWGPGYSSKHSCSNGPFISPLVWFSEIYKGSDETAVQYYIAPDGSRLTRTMPKSEYYLMYARKVYDFQKSHLLSHWNGVYRDMMGGEPISYEEVNGVTYRAYSPSRRPSGQYYPYNTGTMLSGAADLYRVTSDEKYLSDLEQLQKASADFFVNPSQNHPGYMEFDVPGIPDMAAPRRFNTWFYGVLLRGWTACAGYSDAADSVIAAFQQNLDYAWDNLLKEGTLPAYFLGSWNEPPVDNRVEALFTFSYIANFATLASHYISKLD